MNGDPTSLDRLHDIALPPDISWWPLAPGWYLLLGTAFLIVVWLVYCYWKSWQAKGYRRQALQELEGIKDAAAIGELLRRTALAVVPRSRIAEKTGRTWAEWLGAHCADPMAPEVHQMVAGGVYGRDHADTDFDLIKSYAVCWIKNHKLENEKMSLK